LDFFDDIEGWEFEELLVGVEGDCMANEVDGVGLETEFIEHLFGGFCDLDICDRWLGYRRGFSGWIIRNFGWFR
jgi:hypothetical protein